MSGSTTASAVVYGMDPMRGYPVTFHITPVRGRTPAAFLVERADGQIADAEAWQWAAKDAEVLSAEEAADLVTRVARRV